MDVGLWPHPQRKTTPPQQPSVANPAGEGGVSRTPFLFVLECQLSEPRVGLVEVTIAPVSS